jgi:hypothetical protein
MESLSGFTISDGTLISRGAVNISNSIFTVNNGTLWAERVNVGSDITKGIFSLNGDAYIADDLELRGDGAEAHLAGRYFGFGNSPDTAALSSSIIINGLNSILDITGLEHLFLAGQSFIDTENIPMGQSFSVKSDQLAYLIPANLISSGTNPIIFPTGETPPAHGVNPAALPSGATVQTIPRPIPEINQTFMFVFMRFTDRADANAYFQSYFNDPDNRADIENYIESYLTLIGNIDPDDVRTSGHFYTATASSLDLGALFTGDLTNASSRLNTMFSNITRSLSPSVPPRAGAANPFEHIVDTGMVNALPSIHDSNCITPFYSGGSNNTDVLAVIINCNTEHSVLSIKTTYPNVNLILSTGDITVSQPQPFEGLIISNGIINLQSSVKATPGEILPSMRARSNNDIMFGAYLNLTIADDEHETDASWDMNALVRYANWRRE